ELLVGEKVAGVGRLRRGVVTSRRVGVAERVGATPRLARRLERLDVYPAALPHVEAVVVARPLDEGAAAPRGTPLAEPGAQIAQRHLERTRRAPRIGSRPQELHQLLLVDTARPRAEKVPEEGARLLPHPTCRIYLADVTDDAERTEGEDRERWSCGT